MTALTVLHEPMDLRDALSLRRGIAHEIVELELPWICALLERMPRRRHLWEAAAAERGQTLAEWVAIRTAAGSTPPPAWPPGS
jgi:hypothetical protein